MRTLVVVAALLATGCGTPEPPLARASPPGARATPAVAQPDSALMAYLAWQRDWKLLTNRHRAELEVESRRIADQATLSSGNPFAEDPAFRALLDRQRGEMQQLMTRAPHGLTAEALSATIPGVGQMVVGPMEMTFVPGRDEAVLAAARAKYGEEFVRWVLANERTIVATLGASR